MRAWLSICLLLAACAGRDARPSAARATRTKTRVSADRAISAAEPRRTTVGPTPDCTWSPAAPLPSGRRWHDAVVLLDGRVLVAGGGADTLLYDPTRDAWSTAGPLGETRSEHTVTLLADGRVLAVGGTTTPSNGYGRIAQTAELFDPRTGTWSNAGTLNEPRLRHTATRLLDGRVLVTGGTTNAGGLTGQIATTELFDPRTSTWRFGPSLSQTRQIHTASLLRDGRVVVIGGQRWAHDRAETVADVEVLDASQHAWSLATPIPEPRSGHTATVLEDGRLLIVGGWNRDHGRTLIVDLYDAVRDRWTEAAELSVGRDQHASACLPGGRVVVLGGQTNGSLLRGLREAVVEIYDPATDRWTRLGPAPAPVPRMEHSLLVLADGRVLVVGGVDSHYDPPLPSVELGRCR